MSNITQITIGNAEFNAIIEDQRNIVEIVDEVPNTVIVTVPGLSTASFNSNRHIHTQASASATWTITHALGGRPSVTIVDSSSTVVIGDVVYNSDTSITINFSAAFSGFAYLT
jgi:hypothetical protein